MAGSLRSRRGPAINEQALARVQADKERESGDGFDGSWVAHPDLVPVCAEVFGRMLNGRPNQLERTRDDVSVSADQLLDVAATGGAVTDEGLRTDVSVGVQYLASWLGGNGAAAIRNLMEDAATAEISRSQIWQWLHNDVVLDAGVPVTSELVRRVLDEEMTAIEQGAGEAYDPALFGAARRLFEQVALADEYLDFLTLP